MSLPRIIQNKPWHETQAQKSANDDLRRLHSIRNACRSLRDELHGCDWFSSVSHDREYKTIIIKTVGEVAREVALPHRWDGFPVRFQPQD